MRILITFLFAGLLSSSAIASSTPVNLSIEKLISQIWTSEKQSDAVTYYDFQESSAVDIITKNADGSITWYTAFWDLIQENDGLYLAIKQTLTGEEIRFRVTEDNEKLVFSNEKITNILSGIANSAKRIDITKTDLLGMWKSPFYDLKSGEIAGQETKVKHMWKSGFQFNSDGTFVRHLQTGKNAEHESGVWSLSKDGNFIKLHFARNGDVEDIYKRDVLNIEKFNNNWMKVNMETKEKSKSINSFEMKKS